MQTDITADIGAQCALMSVVMSAQMSVVMSAAMSVFLSLFAGISQISPQFIGNVIGCIHDELLEGALELRD
jgi:hypothetical protein